MLNSVTVANNIASSGGGVYYAAGATLTISDSAIAGNIASAATVTVAGGRHRQPRRSLPDPFHDGRNNISSSPQPRPCGGS